MNRRPPGIAAVLAILGIAGAATLAWIRWTSDRAWLAPPPEGYRALVVRVDDSDYSEGLATELMFLLEATSGGGSEPTVHRSRWPRCMWVRLEFEEKPTDDRPTLLNRARESVQACLKGRPIPNAWRIGLVDGSGRLTWSSR